MKGHCKSDCPELQVKELDTGMQNLNIDVCKEGELFSGLTPKVTKAR